MFRVLLPCFLLAGLHPVQAQEILLTKVNPEQVRELLRGSGYETKLTKAGASLMLGKKFVVVSSAAEGKVLVVSCNQFARRSTQTINNWNKAESLTRAVAEDYSSRLEAEFPCELGVNAARLKTFLVSYEANLGRFEQFVIRAAEDQRPGVGVVQTERIAFPFGADPKDEHSAWTIKYVVDAKYSLRIVGAWFQREGLPAIKVLGDVRCEQIYVPYESSSPRYHDIGMGGHGPWDLTKVGGDAKNLLGPYGKLLGNFVVREDRDAGPQFLYADEFFQMGLAADQPRGGTTRVRRRQETVLWGVLQASNYYYILQYSFHDDGTIACRMGSTGKNLYNHTEPGTGHMHSACWRIDVDLGGAASGDLPANTVSQVRLIEKQEGSGRSKTEETPILNVGGVKWTAEEFTALRIKSPTTKNAVGNAVFYDLVPQRVGTARHYAKGDEFTHNDFWVTNFNPQQMSYASVPQYVKSQEPLQGDVVIWHMSSIVHIPRDEDFMGPVQTTKEKSGKIRTTRTQGSAQIMWSGFELRPRSLFSSTPFMTKPVGK